MRARKRMVDGEDQKSEAAICRLLYNSHPKERTWLVPLHHSLPPNIVLPSLPPSSLVVGPMLWWGLLGGWWLLLMLLVPWLPVRGRLLLIGLAVRRLSLL